MALASFNRTSFKKQKPSNSPVVFKFSVHLQECSFHPFRTYTTFIHTLAFKILYRRFKKMRQTFVHTAEVIPVLPHTSSALSSPPFAQLAVGSRPQAINPFDNKVSHSFIIYQL